MFENKTPKELEQHFQTDYEKGLTTEEVERRRAEHGPNRLHENKRKSPILIFFEQFKDPMVIILFVAAAISLILGIVESTKQGSVKFEEFADVIIIFGVVVLNATIGTIQETRAEKALEALKKLSSPTATVRRNGALVEIKAEELVPGDVVILEEGRSVPADLRLIKSASLKTDESSLTGESLPVEKDANLTLSEEVGVGDRLNIVYMSTPVVYGRGEGVVIATGMNTEIGKIANMLETGEDESTPLQKKLGQLSKFLGILTAGIVVLMLGILLLWDGISGTLAQNWSEDLLDAVGLAVAAIPEGLTAVVTIVLAMGMQKMIKVNTIVRRLASVETLGAVSVICSDKTGTLTQNKMTVVATYQDETFREEISEENELLARGMALCSDASIENGVYGDPTEIALIYFADALGMSKKAMEAETPRIGELPFDSVRKMMSTNHQVGDKTISYTKGAMDQLLKHSDSILINGKKKAISDEDIAKIHAAAGEMAERALRVLALAINDSPTFEEEHLTFVGLVGMVDPPREAAKPAVATLKGAGITTIMITGDHKDTAFAIARELGIVESKEDCMSGDQIDECTPKELQDRVKTVRVFARVSPENKVQIVKAVKANGMIVAMTGDGVNDAPSLKNADIGIAMGITGTDVAKGAADMVLTDDNFASIEKAVEEGRGIYANIKKTILFLLSSNIGEVVCMMLAAIIGIPVPLIAIHLLWVNLITDSLPAIALGADRKPAGIMNDKPRNPDESVFAHGGYAVTFGYGAWIGVATLIAFMIIPWSQGIFDLSSMRAFFGGNEEALREARSMAFAVLSFSELFHMLGMTDVRRSFIHIFKDKNWLLWISFIIGFGLQVFVLMTPGVNSFFKAHALVGLDWLWVMLLAVSPLVIHEIIAFALFLKRKLSRK